MSVERERRHAGLERALTYAVGGFVWLWLVFRWLNSWLGGVVVGPTEPLVPQSFAASLESLGASVGAVANGVPVVAVAFDFLGWAVGMVGFASQYGPKLAVAAWLTVVLTVLGILFGLVIAVPLAAARVYGGVSKYVALVYIELIRGTPLVAQLFLLYFGAPFLSKFIRELPFVGHGIVPGQAVWIAIIGFTINSSAYQAEYIRGSVESVDPGQLMAARAVGLDKLEGIRFVVLPQALRYAIPSWTNELVYLIKYSSLATFITVPEIFKNAQDVGSETFAYTNSYVLAAVFYLVLVVTASYAMSKVEDEVAIPGVGSGEGR
ncbi:amino acid ABC transporter permease [Halarchaeum sp. P4]|uniref:amino acid ABC transporter permease n=1 Tax=Halarchaeum sp. P4 TaxID=3421639 RepID=UPI003EC01E39